MINLKTILICLLAAMFVFACKPAAKLQKSSEIVSRIDTTAIAVADTSTAVDSAVLVREVFNKVINNKIDFNTFNTKVKVGYSDKDGGQEGTAFIRVKKDSVIWVSLRGPLGIEGFRAMITKDSVTVINFLKKNVQYYDISFLQRFSGIPVDFSSLQDIVIGNPVFIDSNINSYSSDSSGLKVLMVGNLFKHLATIDNNDYKIVESKLNSIQHVNRTCDILYGGYDNSAGVPFSTDRKISLVEESKLDINLNFKQYSFNQPLTFPFNVPEDYKRL